MATTRKKLKTTSIWDRKFKDAESVIDFVIDDMIREGLSEEEYSKKFQKEKEAEIEEQREYAKAHGGTLFEPKSMEEAMDFYSCYDENGEPYFFNSKKDYLKAAETTNFITVSQEATKRVLNKEKSFLSPFSATPVFFDENHNAGGVRYLQVSVSLMLDEENTMTAVRSLAARTRSFSKKLEQPINKNDDEKELSVKNSKIVFPEEVEAQKKNNSDNNFYKFTK